MLLFVHYFRRYQLLGVPMGRPLDKKEAVLYGQFVHAAYNMFKRDPTQLRPQPATGDIPDPYELVAWLNMSDYFFWWREKPKFYGFIAWHREQKHNLYSPSAGRKAWWSGWTISWRVWCVSARFRT